MIRKCPIINKPENTRAALFMVLIITRLPNVSFYVVLLLFAVWFIVATGRIVTAQTMISEVVPPQQRGSFMSINGSIQQLGSGLAALSAGFIVVTEKSGRLLNYNWVGYLSILVLGIALIYGRFIFRKLETPEVEEELEEEVVRESI